MHLPVTLAAISPGLIIIVFVLFVIGRWVVNQVRESNARARAQAGLENPGQQGMSGPGEQAQSQMQTPTQSGMGMQSSTATQMGSGAPLDPAARERARQMYSERAEMLRAQKMGKAPAGVNPPAGNTGGQMGQAQAQSPSQARMQEPRPLPTQTAAKLPANRPVQTIPGPKPVQQQPAARPQPVKRPAPAAQRPQPAASAPNVPGLAQSYEREHAEAQELQRARVAKSDAGRGQPNQKADARRDPVTTVANITRTVSAMDLRRAVMMREILDPPVSLRE
jgi:hypothetical protein